MLRKVIFLIADREQGAAVEKMKKNMGIEAERICCGDADGWKREGMEECAKGEILFVTDSSVMLSELRQRGDYGIAFLHDHNRQEDFSGAAYAVTDIADLEWESLEKAYLRLAGKPWKVLETDRCLVRETTVEDVEEFYRIYAEPSITYYMEDLFPDPADEKAYIRNYIKEIYGFYGYGLWTVLRKADHEVIGRAGLSWRQGFDMPELGFVIGVPYQRKGYAYEVCEAIAEYGERELGFQEIQALVRKENEASLSLCRKLGFIWEERTVDKGICYERLVRCIRSRTAADDGTEMRRRVF